MAWQISLLLNLGCNEKPAGKLRCENNDGYSSSVLLLCIPVDAALPPRFNREVKVVKREQLFATRMLETSALRIAHNFSAEVGPRTRDSNTGVIASDV